MPVHESERGYEFASGLRARRISFTGCDQPGDAEGTLRGVRHRALDGAVRLPELARLMETAGRRCDTWSSPRGCRGAARYGRIVGRLVDRFPMMSE